MVVFYGFIDIKSIPAYSVNLFRLIPYPLHWNSSYLTILFSKSFLITYFFLLDPFSSTPYCCSNVRSSILVYLFIFLDHSLILIIPPPWCMIFQISSSSLPFDTLVKLLLEIFLYLSFWTYLALLYFSKYLVSPLYLSFLSKWMSFGFIPWFFIPKYLSDSKIFR